MAVQYDSKVIVTFAERLYAQARNIAALYGFAGFVIGGMLGFLWETIAFKEASPFGALTGALMFGLLGYAIGHSRGFALRLQAQTALCQVQIEANTRAAGAPRIAA